MVPDDPMVRNGRYSRTRRIVGTSNERTWVRQSRTALAFTLPPGKNRSVRRIAPSRVECAERTSRPRPTRNSVLPPPMSMTRTCSSNTGRACRTPRWMRRASSTPGMTSISMPASRRARSRKVARFDASRSALVATAVIGASNPWAMPANRTSAAMPRSMASSASRCMSPEPDPSRTISFSVASTSKWPSGSMRATIRWNEFVPRSMAAATVESARRACNDSGLTAAPPCGAGSTYSMRPGGRTNSPSASAVTRPSAVRHVAVVVMRRPLSSVIQPVKTSGSSTGVRARYRIVSRPVYPPPSRASPLDAAQQLVEERGEVATVDGARWALVERMTA